MSASPPIHGDTDIAAVAVLFADPSRAPILSVLADGRAQPASTLAGAAGIAASSASAHLSRLVEGGLLTVQQAGRHRYYRIADERAATALEVLASLASPLPIRSLRQSTRAAALRHARTCYDHLAGRRGVTLTQALLDHRALQRLDGADAVSRAGDDPYAAALPQAPYRLGPDADAVLDTLGVNLQDVLGQDTKRPLLRFCVDWSEQRHHLAGALGASIHRALCDNGYVEPTAQPRAVRLTERGKHGLSVSLGVDVDALDART